MPSTISTTRSYASLSTQVTIENENNGTDNGKTENTTTATQVTNSTPSDNIWYRSIFGIAFWQWILIISSVTTVVGL